MAARNRENRWTSGARVQLQHPGGYTVEVSERRAETLEARGYTRLASTEPSAPSYSSMRKAELQAELESRGLDTEGTVPELVERLQADDEE
jgi:hypothetical protein